VETPHWLEMAEGGFSVEVRHGLTNKGKGLFATRNFKTGETLFTEKPLVSAQFVWNAACHYSSCDHCLRSLETAEQMCRRLCGNPCIELPHPECCTVKLEDHVKCPQCAVAYCSENCRQTAFDQYHKTLCRDSKVTEDEKVIHPLNRLTEAWKQMHYPPETCSISLITRMIAMVNQSSDKQSTVTKFAQFCKATINEEESIAHKLLGKQFQDQLELLRSLLIELFPQVEDIQQWLTPEGFRSLFALIGTNGQGIGTSSFSDWVKNCELLSLPDDEREQLNQFIDKLYSDMDNVAGDFLDCEGSGLYTLQSSCNHSCSPNAEVTFPNSNFELAVRALNDIKIGDEIFISYLSECDQDRSRHSRQKMLRENYLFVCECERCILESDQPDMTSEEEEDSDAMEFCD
jgi:hypothetical protein